MTTVVTEIEDGYDHISFSFGNRLGTRKSFNIINLNIN